MLEQFHQSPISVLHPTKPKTKKFLGPRHLRRQVFGVTKDLHPIMLQGFCYRANWGGNPPLEKKIPPM